MIETFHVRARSQAGVTSDTESSGATGSLQWMPPGESTIHATANGSPKTLKVSATPQTAQMVDRRIKEMLVEAASGKAAQPYIDFDHSDGEAAGWPKSATWGGSDPLTGGVRLQVEWSDVGRAKVKGKSYQGFSPEFNVSSDGVVTDVGLNLGGLVNRPAFTGIQRVTAKQEFEAEIVADRPGQIWIKAAQIKEERNLSDIVEAATIAARENPELYAEYNAKLGGAEPKGEIVKASTHPTEKTEFVIQARSRARDEKLDEVEAARVLCIERPELYQEYQKSLGLRGSSPEALVQARAHATSSNEIEFVVQARAIARAKGIAEADAAIQLASQKPQLYAEYRDDLGKRK